MFFKGGSCNAPGQTNRISNNEQREGRESKGPNESQKWYRIGPGINVYSTSKKKKQQRNQIDSVAGIRLQGKTRLESN